MRIGEIEITILKFRNFKSKITPSGKKYSSNFDFALIVSYYYESKNKYLIVNTLENDKMNIVKS